MNILMQLTIIYFLTALNIYGDVLLEYSYPTALLEYIHLLTRGSCFLFSEKMNHCFVLCTVLLPTHFVHYNDDTLVCAIGYLVHAEDD